VLRIHTRTRTVEDAMLGRIQNDLFDAAYKVRVAARRSERAVVATNDVNLLVQRYLNRLFDHLFALARVLHENAANDVLWVPGANRS